MGLTANVTSHKGEIFYFTKFTSWSAIIRRLKLEITYKAGPWNWIDDGASGKKVAGEAHRVKDDCWTRKDQQAWFGSLYISYPFLSQTLKTNIGIPNVLIIPHSQLNVPWNNTVLLVVPCCITSKFKNLYYTSNTIINSNKPNDFFIFAKIID